MVNIFYIICCFFQYLLPVLINSKEALCFHIKLRFSVIYNKLVSCKNLFFFVTADTTLPYFVFSFFFFLSFSFSPRFLPSFFVQQTYVSDGQARQNTKEIHNDPASYLFSLRMSHFLPLPFRLKSKLHASVSVQELIVFIFIHVKVITFQ